MQSNRLFVYDYEKYCFVGRQSQAVKCIYVVSSKGVVSEVLSQNYFFQIMMFWSKQNNVPQL